MTRCTKRARGDPRLCIARAWVLMDSGRLDQVRAWIEAAEDGIHGPDAEQLYAETAMLHAVHQYKVGDVGQAGQSSRRILELERDKRSFPRTVASCILGITRYWRDAVSDAIDALREDAELARTAENDALGYLGVIHAEQDDLDRAEQLGKTATTLSTCLRNRDLALWAERGFGGLAAEPPQIEQNHTATA